MSLYRPEFKKTSFGKYLLVGLLIIIFTGGSLFSQDINRSDRRKGRGQKTEFSSTPVKVKKEIPDSVLAKRDSMAKVDSVFRIDSLAMLKKSSLTRPAFSEAKDSIVEVFSDGQRKIYYYGDVSVSYESMKLTADYMEDRRAHV